MSGRNQRKTRKSVNNMAFAHYGHPVSRLAQDPNLHFVSIFLELCRIDDAERSENGRSHPMFLISKGEDSLR
ncbi:hypothetical protein T265_14347, partial [Opisthorchis viverrini]